MHFSCRLREYDTTGQRLVETIKQRDRYRLLLVTTNLAVEVRRTGVEGTSRIMPEYMYVMCSVLQYLYY